MDTKTYLESAQTISEACSAALFDHDYTYFMHEADKTWLDNTNYQRRIEEQIAQETPSAETDEIFIRACTSISEDEFELVMGLFEILTGPKVRIMIIVCIATDYCVCSSRNSRIFSFFKPFFLAPLRPDTFASHVVPAWIRPPSVLSSIALTIYPHWQQRHSLRGGRKIFPLLNVCPSRNASLTSGTLLTTAQSPFTHRVKKMTTSTRHTYVFVTSQFVERRPKT
ncbi:hypothetical protein B0H13DRAFT_1589448 [Mycena leptocephala]|nr:hypothetical protein B0H13DRAFT_1589448 [Mycena leptocephala]